MVLARHGVTRQLSTLVLAANADEAPLLDDVNRFLAGQPAIGRAGHSLPPPRTTMTTGSTGS